MRTAPAMEEESSRTRMGSWVSATVTSSCQARWAKESGLSGLNTSSLTPSFFKSTLFFTYSHFSQPTLVKRVNSSTSLYDLLGRRFPQMKNTEIKIHGRGKIKRDEKP